MGSSTSKSPSKSVKNKSARKKVKKNEIVIVHKDHPRTKLKAEALNELMQGIQTSLTNETKLPPSSFNGGHLSLNGKLTLKCDNGASAYWLQEYINSTDYKVETFPEQFERVKINAFVTTFGPANAEETIKAMESLVPGLNTADWIIGENVPYTKDEQSWIMIPLEIDKQSDEVLRTIDYSVQKQAFEVKFFANGGASILQEALEQYVAKIDFL